MTLKEGISMLMSSDATNNALVHESWTDGRYIQCAATDGSDSVRIKVFSRLDSDLNYYEEPFKRKDFAGIKNSGWHIISPEGLVKYAMKNYKKKEKVKPEIQTEESRKTPELLFKLTTENLLRINARLEEEYIKPYCMTEDEKDTLKSFMEICIKDFERWREIYDGFDYTDDVIRDFDSFVASHVTRDTCPELYKKYHNLGLTEDDLRWVHNIELENNIIIDTSDLDDFDNMAAVSVVKRRIAKALKDKN